MAANRFVEAALAQFERASSPEDTTRCCRRNSAIMGKGSMRPALWPIFLTLILLPLIAQGSLQAQSTGVTMLYLPPGHTSGTTPGIVVTPDGSVVPNLSSTVTGGFNEVEAYDFQKGWSTWIVGTGEYLGEGKAPLRSYLITQDAGGFVIHPMANRSVRLTAIQLLCGGSANAGCLNIDSMMKGKIICEGCEIGSQPATLGPNTVAVLINPHTAIPNEGNIVVADSEIDLGNISLNGPGGGSGTGRAALEINIG